MESVSKKKKYRVFDKRTNETLFEADTAWECMKYSLDNYTNGSEECVLIGKNADVTECTI